MAAVIADNSPISQIFACSESLGKVGFTALTYLSCFKRNDAGVEEFWLMRPWRARAAADWVCISSFSSCSLTCSFSCLWQMSTPLGHLFVTADGQTVPVKWVQALGWWWAQFWWSGHYFESTLYGMTTAEPPLMPMIGRAVWVERKSRICATSATWGQNRKSQS